MSVAGTALVGLGGALGAVLRYLICLLPNKSDFPVMTLAVNILGAFIIGIIAGVISARNVNPDLVLFLKTGLCGGFTTFSSFSLETLGLVQKGRTPLAVIYAAASLCGCVLGVKLGEMTAALLSK